MSRMVVAASLLWAVNTASGAQPKWPPTWDMASSTLFMPCNYSGFLDPSISAKWGVVDFDWSNAKGAWTRQHPMDCEERLVAQADLVRSTNPDARVWVYRNLVKALPWYSNVREKLLDPQYEGFFLKFNPGGSSDFNNGTWHMPKCTESKVGNPPKCSDFYHDHEQTPSNGDNFTDGPTKYGDWTVWQPYNGVGGHLQHCDSTNHSSSCQVWVAPGQKYADWESCSKAADAAMATNPLIHIFTWWKNPGANATQGSCWLSQHLYAGTGGPEKGHVMGYKGPASERPNRPASINYNVCDGDCDCGESLPCGEYLWDHRNGTMLREFLINEFILNDKTGLGNKAVSGFFFDDGWTDKPSPIPSWAPPTYRQCDMSSIGGATEEDFFCTVDMGLTQDDTTKLKQEHDATMSAVFDAVITHGGFVFQQLTTRAASLDLADPRPPAKCKSFLRRACTPGAYDNSTLLFEFTRKKFHDSFPLPHVVEDVAQFLLVRQEYAYMGYSWMGCIAPSGFVQGNSSGWEGYPRPKEIEVDYGVPVDNTCTETGKDTGVFERRWSKATATMDCNHYKGTITLH